MEGVVVVVCVLGEPVMALLRTHTSIVTTGRLPWPLRQRSCASVRDLALVTEEPG
jgi:hypothetical protein